MDDEWDRYSTREPIESPDPIAICAGNAHGTHVAGMFVIPIRSCLSLVLVIYTVIQGSSACKMAPAKVSVYREPRRMLPSTCIKYSVALKVYVTYYSL